MTSAPNSAMTLVANGPAISEPSSRTRKPANGPVGAECSRLRESVFGDRATGLNVDRAQISLHIRILYEGGGGCHQSMIDKPMIVERQLTITGGRANLPPVQIVKHRGSRRR